MSSKNDTRIHLAARHARVRTYRNRQQFSQQVSRLPRTAPISNTFTNGIWQGPAFSAGLRPGLVVARVGDQPFSFQAFADGIAEATRNGKDLPLAVADSGEERRVTIAAVAAQTWPILVRKPGSRDWLSEILRARRK